MDLKKIEKFAKGNAESLASEMYPDAMLKFSPITKEKKEQQQIRLFTFIEELIKEWEKMNEANRQGGE